MGRYQYECPVCKRRVVRHKRMANLDQPEFCSLHTNSTIPMTRLFTADFQIIGRPEKDKPENQIFNILTRGGGETDKLALMREEEKRMERTYDSLQPAAKPAATMEDLLQTGIMEAARRPDSLANWRAANVKEKTFQENETIPL